MMNSSGQRVHSFHSEFRDPIGLSFPSVLFHHVCSRDD